MKSLSRAPLPLEQTGLDGTSTVPVQDGTKGQYPTVLGNLAIDNKTSLDTSDRNTPMRDKDSGGCRVGSMAADRSAAAQDTGSLVSSEEAALGAVVSARMSAIIVLPVHARPKSSYSGT